MKSFPKNHLARLLAGIAGAAFAFAAPQAHAQTLLHHWTFDTDGSDSAGSADTTLEEGATITTGSAGQFGEALSVPSDAVGAATADAAAVTLPASDFTFTAWVKVDASSPDGNLSVMGNQNGGASGAFLRIDDEAADGDVFGRVNDGGAGFLIEGGTVDKDVWTHVAMTVSSTAGLTIYVNGAPAGNNPAGTSHVISDLPFEIGTRPLSAIQDFWGLIDDVAVYDGVLSEAELNTARIHGAAAFAGIAGGVTVDDTASTVEASPAAVPADGSTTSTITVTLRDSNYQGVAGKNVSLAMTAAGPQAATIGTPNPAVTDSFGRATFTVTSNTVGSEVFEATNDTDTLTLTQTDSVEFQIAAGPVDENESTVVATPTEVPADGSAYSTITVTLKDAGGLAVEGEGVTLSGSTGNAVISTPNPATTDANGEATFTVSSSTVENEIFTATSVTDSVVVTQTASVDFQTPPVQELLFYESFTYPAGDLDGQGGWNATSAQVRTSSFTDDQGTTWDGTITAVPTCGGGFIAQSGVASYDHALDPSITSSFVPGTTTWLSVVAFQGTNGANARWGVAIGAAPLNGADEMDGEGIGVGQLLQSTGARAHYWIPNEGGSDRTTSAGPGGGRPVFAVLKIDWAADGSNDTITMVRWDQNFPSTPTSTDWDNATKYTITADLDQSTFDTLSVYSSYGFIDEIRIATSFDLAVIGTFPARIGSFAAAGATGVIDQSAKTIALEVPFGTDLATLAPTFTLTSGSCNQTSGAIPSPDFGTSNPVTYTVTDASTDPDTINNYTVTVTVAAPPTPTTTLVIDLGAGTVIEGGTFGSHGTNLPLPALPVGSILRSIETDLVLEATDNDNWASDLAVLLDPTPGTPGGDFSVEITNGTASFGATVDLDWPSEANNSPVTPLADTKSDADWFSTVGDIDLASTGLFLGNAFGGPTVGGTWSGTITLTYDLVSGGSGYAAWSGGEPFSGDKNGDGVSNGIAFLLGADDPDANALGLLPASSEDGSGGLVLTFSCLNAANRGDSTLSVEHSSDLGISDAWSGALVPDVEGVSGPVNGVLFDVTLGDPLNSVTATIQPTEAADGKVFGRLSGTE